MHIRVYGTPAPQGSKTAIVRGGKAIMFESSKKLMPWRDACIMASKMATTEAPTPLLGPLKVQVTFYLERPKSTVRDYPNNAPDVDKLLRGVFDSLQIAEVIMNDGQIVDVDACKLWADENHPPGAVIDISGK
jgi:Holliday junction resolvase RusA-like endonuclease